MEMREDIDNLELTCWTGTRIDLDRFYKAAYLVGAKAMQEEAAKRCRQYANEIAPFNIERAVGADKCKSEIRAIDPDKLAEAQ